MTNIARKYDKISYICKLDYLFMELYEHARPDLMAGKKLLFIHGFASSGQSGTVRSLRTLLPETEIVAPDVPTVPAEGAAMLKQLCEEEKPDLILGTSMGGMYAEQIKGFDRILVNPALQIGDTILKNIGLGRKEFHNPRADGEISFLITKGTVEEFKEVTAHCFEGIDEMNVNFPNEGNYSEEQNRVYGLFGIHDELVHTYDLFAAHYPNAIRYDGEHSLNDKALLHSVLPVIQWIDDKQEGRTKKTIFISLEDTLADFRNNIPKGKKLLDCDPEPSAVKAFEMLSRKYDVRILASAPYNHPELWGEMVAWAEKWIGVPAWNRVIISNRKDLIMGDYVIDRYADRYGLDNCLGTVLGYGKEPYHVWEDILTFFDRLGGQ